MPATSEYTLGGKDVDLANMVGVIKTPSGGIEPCLLKKMSDGKLGMYELTSINQSISQSINQSINQRF